MKPGMSLLNDPALRYKIAIDLIPGIGGVLAKKLIEASGSPENVFKLDESELLKIPGIGKSLAGNIANQQILSEADKELRFISRYGIEPLYYLDDNYPARLKECPDSPVILFYKGNASLDSPRVLSIVGTRKASSYGLEFCTHLVSELASRGHDPVIVSGLAYGIDIAAHKAALERGLKTVAVLAHGLSTIYPAAHRNIAQKISRQGALVTDFGSGNGPERGNFLKRNRIIAGLADATIVIESSRTGGALITANLANSYNRDVFALPGRITDQRSHGCNELIKTHRAHLIEKVEDLEYIMGWEPEIKADEDKDVSTYQNISETEKSILLLLSSHRQLTADQISGMTGLGSANTSFILLNLEFMGDISSMPGKIYSLTNIFS